MYNEIHGEGKPLLLLHGSYMTIDMNWTQQIPEWSENYKVIAVEMQAHGRIADIESELSCSRLAEDAVALYPERLSARRMRAFFLWQKMHSV